VADRLRRDSDIAAVFTSRRRRGGRYLVVHVGDAPCSQPARVAVVASRRVGSAVQRNRAKRLLREAARTVPMRAGRDVVLVARGSILDVGLAQVRAELTDLVRSLDLDGTS